MATVDEAGIPRLKSWEVQDIRNIVQVLDILGGVLAPDVFEI
jgi:hypothetical protein